MNELKKIGIFVGVTIIALSLIYMLPWPVIFLFIGAGVVAFCING